MINSRNTNIRAFTLIELLAVIAVIAVLAAILITAISGIRVRASIATSASDLRQVWLAVNAYSLDHSGVLPGPCRGGVGSGFRSGDPVLARYIAPYLTSQASAEGTPDQIQIVPQLVPSAYEAAGGQYDANGSAIAYQLNVNAYGRIPAIFPFGYPAPLRLAPLPRIAVDAAGETWMIEELDQDNLVGNPSWKALLPEKPMHGNVRNVLYWDGHVSSVPVEEK